MLGVHGFVKAHHMVCTQGLCKNCRLGFVGTQVLNAGVYRSVIKLDYNPRQLGLSPLKAVEADLLSLCIQA